MTRGGILCIIMLACLLRGWTATPTTERWPNGLRVVVQPSTASPLVSVELLIDYSALDEPARLSGLRQVLLNTMLAGSATFNGAAIDRALTAMGGQLEGRVHQDMLEFTLTVPANALATGLTALSAIVCHPQLADETVWSAIARAEARANTPPVGALDTASRYSRAWLYNGHPYATDGNGNGESLARITPDLVREAYDAYILPGASVLAIAGRCHAATARALALARFQEWAGHPRPARPPITAPALEASDLHLWQEPVNITCVMLTFPVCGVEADDYLTLRLIDTLLAGGTSGRLFRTIREQRHLAYEVATEFPAQADSSYFSVYALVRTADMEDSKSALIDELTRLQTETVPEQELQRAKAYLQGRYLLSHQYSAQYAYDLASYVLLGKGAEYDRGLAAAVDAITPADIQRVACQYFTRYYLVVVMPLTKPPVALE